LSLSESLLRERLMSIFSDPVKSYAQAEVRLGHVYHEYASQAVDASGDSLLSSNPSGFRSALRFSGISKLEFASQMDTAMQSYWTGAAFGIGSLVVGTGVPCPNVGGTGLFSSEISSLVSVVTPGVMRGALLADPLSLTRNNSMSAAVAFARAMHLATSSAVLVLIAGLDTTPPPGGPLPVTNTCHLF